MQDKAGFEKVEVREKIDFEKLEREMSERLLLRQKAREEADNNRARRTTPSVADLSQVGLGIRVSGLGLGAYGVGCRA